MHGTSISVDYLLAHKVNLNRFIKIRTIQNVLPDPMGIRLQFGMKKISRKKKTLQITKIYTILVHSEIFGGKKSQEHSKILWVKIKTQCVSIRGRR